MMRRLAFLLTLLVAGSAIAAPTGSFNQDVPLITLTAAGAGNYLPTNNPAVLAGDQFNGFGKGLQLGINITAVTGTPSLTVTVQGKDTASGVYYTLCASAALSATGFTLMTVYPGTTAAANTVCNVPLPATWRVLAVISGTSPVVTGTIGASVIK